MNKAHKQDNFILYFPMYVCLGVYYVIYTIISPILKLWNKSSDTLYTTINNKNNNVSGGVNMTDNDKKVKEMINEPRKTAPIKINMKDLKSRDDLIKALDQNPDARYDHQVIFKYDAIDINGNKTTSYFKAFSKMEVYTFLENEGYKVLRIETSNFIDKLYGQNSILGTRKIKIKDIVFWLQQLSTYIKSGIPLTDSMRILTKQMGRNSNIKRVFNSVVYNLTLGESFSSSLDKQGKAFPPLLINMIRAAEATGDLEGTLDEMAIYYSETESTRKEMISALTYPLIIMCFSIGVVVFILIYMIPKFVGIYETAGVTLNPITAFIINASIFLQQNLTVVILVLAMIITLIVVLYKNVKAVKYSIQTFMMKLPVIGNVIIYKEMMIFTKTFASLLKNNVFITESIDILRKVTENEIYRKIMVNTINYVTRGDKISSAFKDNWAIPDVAYYMMVTGESTGELAEMMDKVSHYYGEQHKMIVTSMKSLIEPILIVFLAVVVGGIMIAVIVPMFSLYGNIS